MGFHKGLKGWSQRPVRWESIALVALCMLDLVSTVILVGNGLAKEANPILAAYMNQSIAAFIAAKIFFSMAPIVGLEIVGWVKPFLARFALRFGLVAYIGTYIIGSLHTNHWF